MLWVVCRRTHSGLSCHISTAIYKHEGGGSGGYLEYTMRHAAKELFGLSYVEPLEYKVMRNKVSIIFPLLIHTRWCPDASLFLFIKYPNDRIIRNAN